MRRHSGIQMLTVARNAAGADIWIEELASQRVRLVQPPECFCPACDQPVIARMGEVNRHHFAHKAGATGWRCWGSTREGAAHLAAKAGLRRFLEAACSREQMLKVTVTCQQCQMRRSSPVEVLHLLRTDRVLVERRVRPDGTIRPDLQIVDSNGTRLLVEVIAWHGAGWAKVSQVRQAGWPLLEIEAGVALDVPVDATSLHCAKVILEGAEMRCETCANPPVETVGPPPMPRPQAPEVQTQPDETAAEVLPVDWDSGIHWADTIAEARILATVRVAKMSWSMTVARAVLTSEPLEVRATWRPSGEVVLELVGRFARRIARWEGTAEEMTAIYGGELRERALEHLYSTGAKVDLGADFELTEDFAVHTQRESPRLARPRDDFHPHWDAFVREETARIVAERTSIGMPSPGAQRWPRTVRGSL